MDDLARAVITDFRLSPDACRVVLYVLHRGEGEHEISHREFARLLQNPGEKRLRAAVQDAVDLYLIRTAGGRGHHDRYAFSPAARGNLNGSEVDFSPAPRDNLKDSPAASDTLNTDSPAARGSLNEPVGGDYRGGSSSVVIPTSVPDPNPQGNGVGGRRGRKRPNVALPAEWTPTEPLRAFARELGVSAEREADKMRDWAAAKDERCADWDARFRNWLRRASSDRRPAPTRTLFATPEEVRLDAPVRPVKSRMIVEHEEKQRRAAGGGP
jgi:hypothetical protein